MHTTIDQRKINEIVELMNSPEKLNKAILETREAQKGWENITEKTILQAGNKIRYRMGANWDERTLSQININQKRVAAPMVGVYVPLGSCQVYIAKS